MTSSCVTIDHRRASDVRSLATSAHTSSPGGTSTRHEFLHRDRASAERPRSCHHRRRHNRPHKGASMRSGEASTSSRSRATCSSRCEIFDEADLDAALARFEELRTQTPRLKNAVAERFVAQFAARDWDAVAQYIRRRILLRRSSSGRQCRGPTRSRCRDRRPAGSGRRRVVDQRDVDSHRGPRRTPHSHALSRLGSRNRRDSSRCPSGR